MRTAILLTLLALAVATPVAAQPTPHPVLFVTQFPIADDFGTIGSVFANHRTNVARTGRGGDLYIRYPDGTLRNLTREAGFGEAGVQQGARAIAVRDPAVHWSGTRAVFAMVIGAPVQQYQESTVYWQLYEVTGLGQGQAASITRVAGQPADYNNVMPTYASDGGIIFVTDRPRSGQRHHYPQHDEYESTPTVTGVWKLGTDGTLRILEHSPSGSFDPLVDSYGRILFSRWDHLQRDQQNEDPGNSFGTFNYASEAASAQATSIRTEVFPEPRIAAPGSNVQGLRVNHFFPWQLNQDGTEALTLNHLGRHELHAFFERSFTDDGNLRDFTPQAGSNPYRLLNFLQLAEDPTRAGRYYAVNAPEFNTLNSGQIIRFEAGPSMNADAVRVESVTHPATGGTTPGANHSGHYRNPAVLADGRVVVSHTTTQVGAGAATGDISNYMFRLALLVPAANGSMTGGAPLTGAQGIVRQVRFWSPDRIVEYNGPMWELSAVEVRARPVPPSTALQVAAPELQAFTEANVNLAQFQAFLRERNLGVVVMRDVTTRDRADRQQPFNLRVAGGGRATPTNPSGRVYDIAHMQFLQGDQIRGHTGGGSSPQPGRRVLAQPMNDNQALSANGSYPGAPAGALPIAADGSVAAFVPATRALSWQSTSPTGQPVVRERYWISLQPGEVRACDGCHGANTANQAGMGPSTQVSQAFVALLQRWSADAGIIFVDGME